jgi:hypothetical protein
MLTFTVTIRPIGRSQFEVYHGSDLLCVSRNPLCDASRVLLSRGYAGPRDIIEMWHEGHAYWSLTSQVGKAAGLTVTENPVYGPMFRRIDLEASSSPIGASNCIPMDTPSFA